MRKLVSIQKVSDVIEHPNADLLELAKINGWICVVKKGEFKPGDLGVYFEIDSFLPSSDERFSFLSKSFLEFEGIMGARIHTLRLRGELSQGLLLPLSLFPEVQGKEIGEDATEAIGVLKYEKPFPLDENAKGHFPWYIRKTEQERIQNLLHIDRSGEWERTEKLNGVSLTVSLNENEFSVSSRNLELLETDDNPSWIAARECKLEEKLREYGQNIGLQGELLGPGIQKNRYQMQGFAFRLFDIYDIDQKRRLLPEERKEVLAKLNTYDDLLIEETPFLGYVTLPEEDDWMEQLLKEANGKSLLNPKTIREGDVYKHRTKNLSFKVISNQFLLKYDD